MLKLDAHQHFWIFDPIRDHWITADMQSIRRNFLPADLEPILKLHQVAGCIAVQADQSEAETELLLDLAERHSFIRGVVGWIDLRSANLERQLIHCQSFVKLKGFRHIVQAESAGFMMDSIFLNGIKLLTKYGFSYDILIRKEQLKEATRMVEQNPGQSFVLDHLAKPDIAGREMKDWVTDLRLLAQKENVYCKLSGMVTEAALSSWKAKEITPYMDAALEAFGAERLMFGSDWPVCKLAAEYEEVLALVEDFLFTLSVEEQQQIWGKNASSFYRLDILPS